jgi:hypothetical protein
MVLLQPGVIVELADKKYVLIGIGMDVCEFYWCYYSFLGNFRNSGKYYPLWIRAVTSKFVPVEASEPFEVSSAAVTNSVLDGLKFLTEKEYEDAEKDLAKWKNDGTTTPSTSRGKRACRAKKPESNNDSNNTSFDLTNAETSSESEDSTDSDDFDAEKETQKEERRAAILREQEEQKRRQSEAKKQQKLKEKAERRLMREAEKAERKLQKRQAREARKAESKRKQLEEIAKEAEIAEAKKRKAEDELQRFKAAEEAKKRKFDQKLKQPPELPEEVEEMSVETKKLNRYPQQLPRASSNVGGANSFTSQSSGRGQTFANFQAEFFKLERDQEMEKRHKCERDALLNEFSHNF